MKKLLAGFVAVLFAAPLVASAQTTRPAARPSGDTKAPAWKADPGLHETFVQAGTDGRRRGSEAGAAFRSPVQRAALGALLHGQRPPFVPAGNTVPEATK